MTQTTPLHASAGEPAATMHAGRLALTGSLAIYDVARLKPQLIGAIDSQQSLELDLSGIELIDTAGAQLLMLAKLHALSLSRTFSLSAHSPAVVELFELMQLAGFFGDPIILPAQSSTQDTA